MNSNRVIVACAALVLVTAASRVSAACQRNDHGAFEDISCAVAALEAATIELETLLGQLYKQLSSDSVATLRKSQEVWTDYLTAETNFVLATEGSGSAGRLAVANNSERATRARTLELRQWSGQK